MDFVKQNLPVGNAKGCNMCWSLLWGKNSKLVLFYDSLVGISRNAIFPRVRTMKKLQQPFFAAGVVLISGSFLGSEPVRSVVIWERKGKKGEE